MTVPSREPLTVCLRLGLNATEVTPSLWPLKDLLRAGSLTPTPEVAAPYPLLFILAVFD